MTYSVDIKVSDSPVHISFSNLSDGEFGTRRVLGNLVGLLFIVFRDHHLPMRNFPPFQSQPSSSKHSRDAAQVPGFFGEAGGAKRDERISSERHHRDGSLDTHLYGKRQHTQHTNLRRTYRH